MSKILLVEYMERDMIKTALIDNIVFHLFRNGVLQSSNRTISNVRKIVLCDVPYDYDYKSIHDIIDTMMKEFDYSYEYVNGECEVFLRINVYRDSPRVECHTIPLDNSKLNIEHIKDISTYIKRFIR